ncbi:hypothetical protein B7463_g5787, partial [Scytalidium lignicola]
MPTYLLHGFRWHRKSILLHVIFNDLDDAAPEWIIAPATSITLLNSFYSLFDFLPPSHPPSTGVAAFPMTRTKRDMQERRDMAGIGPAGARPPATSAGEERTTDAGGHGAAAGALHKRRSIQNLGLLARPMSRMLSTSDVPDRIKHSRNGNGNGNGNSNGLNSSMESSPGSTSENLPRSKEPRFNDWSVVKFIEQYDANELVVSQPWAYIADYVVEVPLGVSITEEMERYEVWKSESEGTTSSVPDSPVPAAAGSRSSTLSVGARGMKRRSKWVGWFERLRDSVEKNEKVGWYVVVCEDEERAYSPPDSDEDEEDVVVEEESKPKNPRTGMIRDFLNKRKSGR